MKWISIFWILVVGISCENYQREILPLNQAGFAEIEIVNRWQIVGDFDGDSILDTLKESYFSKITQKEIPKFQFDHHTTQALVDTFINNNQPRTSFYILGEKDNRQGAFYGADYPTFGISGILNLGDVDNDKGDEIGIVVGSADHSSVSSCEILSYKNNEWVKINFFQIHELQIWNNQRQEVVMERKQKSKNKKDLGTEEQGIFFKENGKVYIYSYDAIEGKLVESIL